MAGRLAYVDGRGGTWALDSPDAALVGTGAGLRGWEWSRQLQRGQLVDVRRDAREVDVKVHADAATLDRMEPAMWRDVADGTPGTLVLDGTWRQAAQAVSCSCDGAYMGMADATVTFALLDGCWHNAVTTEFRPRGGGEEDGGGLDAPYDLPADLGPTHGSGTVDAGDAACPVRLVIYGPVASPSLTIAHNLYAFDVDVPDGARLEVDATGARKTIHLVGRDGQRTDAFGVGLRNGGEGSGGYCFERVPAGEWPVQWDGSFGVDVTLWHQREGLPWT